MMVPRSKGCWLHLFVVSSIAVIIEINAATSSLVSHYAPTRRSVPSFVTHFNSLQSSKKVPSKYSKYVPQHRFPLALKNNRNDDDISSKNASSTPDLPRPGSMAAFYKETGQVAYGEESRQYRRTVFLRTSDWAKHRSPDRLFTNLRYLFRSGVARQLKKGVQSVTSVALVAVLWNAMLTTCRPLVNRPTLLGYFSLSIPAQPFALSSFALGLLLVFRTNASYQRWLEGQNNISNIVAQLKNLLRMTSTWLPAGAEGQQMVKDTGLACWAVLRSVQSHLRSREQEEAGFSAHVQRTLNKETAEKLLSSKDRPFWAIHDLSAIIQKMPIDGGRVREMDKAIVSIMCSIESCTKSIRYPIPLVYTRLTARFLTAWLLLLPLAMYESFAQNRLLLIPTSAFISFFFFGIDELAIQLEEPFSILPLEYSCANMKQMAKQAVLWHAKAQ